MVSDLIHAILDSIKSAYVHHRIIDHVKQFFCVRAQDRGGEWRFQTKRQVWILKHLYSQNVIDKTFFKKLVLPYISTLHGGAKERVLTEAQGYLQREAGPVRSDLESEEDKEGRGEGGEKGSDRRDSRGMTEVGESTNRVRRKRAKKIVAALADAEGAKDEESTK
ncbi:Protein of unknown function DUF2373 [Nannochloropsis gaditana]|uniref:WKF domain-containing protein n=1 Tax=Nannochloropsis gaditana TaxID=72520 RepID=W7TS81_9STRA|nr:Protein of unknown function DUF2373 [Nannochloropsis gaditana]